MGEAADGGVWTDPSSTLNGWTSGKTSAADRARFHAIARGSAFECAAILDVLQLHGAVATGDVDEGKVLLSRVVAMLSKMCR